MKFRWLFALFALLLRFLVGCLSEPEIQKDESISVDTTKLTSHPAYAGLLEQAKAKGKDGRWLNARASIDGDAIVLDEEAVLTLEDASIAVPAPQMPDVHTSQVNAGCTTTTTWCPGYGGTPGITGKTFRSASSGYGTLSCRYTNTGTSAPSYYYPSTPAGVYPCDKCCSDTVCAAWGGTTPSPLGYCSHR